MSTVDVDQLQAWARDNQRHLALAAAAVAARLDARPEEAAEPEGAAALLAAQVVRTTGASVALDHLCAVFRLTRFERDILVGAAAAEMGLPAAIGPVTFARALASLEQPHWSALLPDGPLRGWRLLDVPSPLPPPELGGLSHLPLAVDERVLHALLGAVTVDDRLAGRARVATEVCRLAPSQASAVASLAALVVPSAGAEPVLLVGEDALTRRQAVLDAAGSYGLSVLVVDAADVPDDPPTAVALARLLAREAVLGGRLVLVEAVAETARRALGLLTGSSPSDLPAVLGIDEPPAGADLPVVRLGPASAGERRALFTWAVDRAGAAAGGPGDAAALATHYPLTPAGIALGVTRAARLAAAGPPDLAGAFRAMAGRPLHGLASVRRPTGRLDGLVLAEPTRRALVALLAHVRQRDRVHVDWGFGERDRGLAVTALFAGASGTGKTSAAEAVAAELGLDVIAVDLSQVVSKYIGETEKHLARLFSAAEAGAVLLFDEGDALFAKRTQVRDSRDRYANLEVSYLLQRLETFTGIAIVTTNTRDAIDPAFTRRMRFVVSFPFPDAEQRARLWATAFPAGVPTAGLDPVRLAQLAVSGGTIAQLATHATILAADADTAVGMAHVLEAARIECDKLERPLAAAEIRGWA